MAVSNERYQFAEQLYVFTGRSIDEIAEITGIPRRSLFHRAKTYKWTSIRMASLRSPAILVEEMYRELSTLTMTINQRPDGQKLATPQEAELRRKIINSITAVKKFPCHAEVIYIMQSLLRYSERAYHDDHKAVAKLIDGFLSQKDMYGYRSYQPENGQDLHTDTDIEQRERFHGPEDLSDPEDMPHQEDILFPGETYLSHKKAEEEDLRAETQDRPISPHKGIA